jgi:hypothetical protein
MDAGRVRKDTDTLEDAIRVYDHDSQQNISISDMTTNTAYKLLRIHMSFDGNTEAQINNFQSKCENMAVAFLKCHLSPDEALQGYRSIFLPGIRYGNAATNMPVKAIRKAQKIITSTILPKLGYNRNTPRQIVFGPPAFGGIGMLDMAVEQGLAHTSFLLGHMRGNSEIAKLSKY